MTTPREQLPKCATCEWWKAFANGERYGDCQSKKARETFFTWQRGATTGENYTCEFHSDYDKPKTS